MGRNQRTWLVGINITMGLGIGVGFAATWLLLITDHLGLTTKVGVLRWLSSMQQPLTVIAIAILMGGMVTSAWIQRRSADSC